MVEHKKIYRVFQLISRLRSPFGATKENLARDYDVSERTVERYFNLLRDLGFEIVKEENRFRIPRVDRGSLNPEDLIVFSLEEAALIRDAILASSINTPLQKSLVSKLNALTDMDDVSETIYRQSISQNIGKLRESIKQKQQVVLLDYSSASSNTTRDRLVEPIRFFSYYVYLLAFDVEVGEVRQFKIDRIGNVEQKNNPWQYEEQHGLLRIDHFGMSGHQSIPVKLKLSNLSHKLLVEECPDAELNIKKTESGAVYGGSVFSFEGIGRFIMGLINEVEVVEPVELQRYVEHKVMKWVGEK